MFTDPFPHHSPHFSFGGGSADRLTPSCILQVARAACGAGVCVVCAWRGGFRLCWYDSIDIIDIECGMQKGAGAWW
eukprot:scaffold6978_cov155-Isochrysis_galbana.AAC.3